jgi:hypothetical protein
LRDSPIQIGALSLRGFEVPSSVRFGGRHRLAIHNLAGGRRVVERLGPDDSEISFHGTFSGPNAAARVRAFDTLRLSGEIVWLTWDSFRRRVVVKTFVAEYHSPWWIPYRVSCLVVHQSGVAMAGVSTLSALLSDNLNAASAAIAGSIISLDPLRTALLSENAMTTGTSDQARAVVTVGTTLGAINAQIALRSALVCAPIGARADSQGLCRQLASTVSSAGLLASAVNARSYVGRIATLLNGSGS